MSVTLSEKVFIHRLKMPLKVRFFSLISVHCAHPYVSVNFYSFIQQVLSAFRKLRLFQLFVSSCGDFKARFVCIVFQIVFCRKFVAGFSHLASQCHGSGMFIPDPNFSIREPVSRVKKIPDPHQRIKYF